MAFVMATENEVFGRGVGGIDVAVEVEYGDDWLCCGRKYLRFILASKAVHDCVRRRI